MATVINNPSTESEGSGAGFLLGVLALLLFLFLLFYWGLPAIRNTSSGSTFSVPEKIDVNINQPK